MTAVDGPPPAARMEGSIATAAFDAAAVVLAAAPVDPPDRPLPLRYLLPSGLDRRVDAAVVTSDEGRATHPGRGPLAAALAAQAAGTVSAVDLLDRSLAAIAALDGPLGGMVAVDHDGARAAALAADADRAAGRWRGPLHGIPITVKDVIHVAGLPTRAGSAVYEHHPVADAAAVARLRQAGAVIVGKVSTHEFALGVTSPQSRNPHDHERIPGGSSGGSAVSVATGMALASLGTDTRASIRVPAALSGVVGFKPTIGLVPTDGVVTLSWTMDHVAPMAATVGDAALVLDALFGRGSALAAVAPATRIRVGVVGAASDGADPGVAATLTQTLEGLARRGVALQDAPRPDTRDLELANAVGLVVSRAEAATAHRALGLDRSRYWEEVADQLEIAAGIPAVDYLDAQRTRGQLADELLRCFADVDVLAMPTVPITAPLATDFARHLMLLARNAIPWSLVGFPAVSVPCGIAGGLPVGIQLVAPPHREDLLVALGLLVEEVRPDVTGP